MGRLRQVLDDFRKEVRKPKRRWIALAAIMLIAVCGYLVVQSLGKNYHYQEGQRALEANDFEAARKHLLLALKSDPQNTDVLLLLARTARHAGDFNEATEYLAKCRRLGGIPEAIKLEYDLQQVQRGYLLSSLENHLWAYVKVNHPDSVEILDALARGYMHSVRLERACATFDELLKRRPDDVQALLLRGRLQLHKSKLQEAAADFRRILDELDPNNDEARRNLAKILVDFSQFPEAFPLYQGLAKQHPDDPEVALALIRCQLALKAPEAPALLDRLAGRFPDNAEIQVERAKMDMEALEFDKAEARLRQVLEKNPYHRGAISRLVKSLSVGKKSDLKTWQARLKHIEGTLTKVQQLTKELERNPRDAALRCELGKLMLSIGSDREGLILLRGALDVDPADQDAHRALSDYFRSKGRLDLAAEHDLAVKNTASRQP